MKIVKRAFYLWSYLLVGSISLAKPPVPKPIPVPIYNPKATFPTPAKPTAIAVVKPSSKPVGRIANSNSNTPSPISHLATTFSKIPDSIPKAFERPAGMSLEIRLDIYQILPSLDAYFDTPAGVALLNQLVDKFRNSGETMRPTELAQIMLKQINQRSNLQLTDVDIAKLRTAVKQFTNLNQVQVQVYYDEEALKAAIYYLAELVACRYYNQLDLGFFRRFVVRRYCRGRNWFNFVPNYLRELSSEEARNLPQYAKFLIEPAVVKLGLKNFRMNAFPLRNFSLEMGYRATFKVQFYDFETKQTIDPRLEEFYIR